MHACTPLCVAWLERGPGGRARDRETRWGGTAALGACGPCIGNTTCTVHAQRMTRLRGTKPYALGRKGKKKIKKLKHSVYCETGPVRLSKLWLMVIKERKVK